MPKHEPMTAKAIGKRIKSKGLQKLKFFCQMCQKQCRDQNGFKCHLTSEAHQRQLLLFAENPGRYLADFSGEFLKDFLHLLKRRYSTKRVFANQVYQEYIKDREHLHMNATRWSTLTGFVKWMGRMGICIVDQTEKGFFITYVDRDPETLLRKDELAKKEKMAKDDEERQQKLIGEMIERGKKAEEGKKRDNVEEEDEDEDSKEEKMKLKKESDDQKIVFAFAPKKVLEKTSMTLKKLIKTEIIKKEEQDEDHVMVEVKEQPKPLSSVFKMDFKKEVDSKDSLKRKLGSSSSSSSVPPPKKRSALDDIIEEQERWKARKVERNTKMSAKPETWLLPGIVVRVVTKDLGSEFYNKKATVEKLLGDYEAVIRMDSTGAKVKVDEQHLETVVPREGSRVMVLKGQYRGRKATVSSVDADKERIGVLVDNASVGGRTVELKFDDVSKFV